MPEHLAPGVYIEEADSLSEVIDVAPTLVAFLSERLPQDRQQASDHGKRHRISRRLRGPIAFVPPFTGHSTVLHERRRRGLRRDGSGSGWDGLLTTETALSWPGPNEAGNFGITMRQSISFASWFVTRRTTPSPSQYRRAGPSPASLPAPMRRAVCGRLLPNPTLAPLVSRDPRST